MKKAFALAGALLVAVVTVTAAQGAPWTVAPTPTVSIGSADGALPYQLDRVFGAVRLADGTIVIGNSGSSELRLFDARGKFLRAIGRRGAGPGEFGEFSSVRPIVYGNRIISDDGGNSRVLTFELNGRGTTSFRLDPSPSAARAFLVAPMGNSMLGMAALGGGLRGPPGAMIQVTMQYAIYDTTGTRQRVIFEIPERPRIVHAYQGVTHYPYVPLTAAPIVLATDSVIYLIRGDAPEIEVWSPAGTLVRKFTWPAKRVATADVWAKYRQAEMAGMTSDRDRTLYGHFYEMTLPLPRYVPLARGMLSDPAGNLWIERYRLPGEKKVEWDVLNPRGRPLGTVVMPEGLQVFQIGSDFVLGRVRDSLDVEMVRLYRLEVAR